MSDPPAWPAAHALVADGAAAASQPPAERLATALRERCRVAALRRAAANGGAAAAGAHSGRPVHLACLDGAPDDFLDGGVDVGASSQGASGDSVVAQPAPAALAGPDVDALDVAVAAALDALLVEADAAALAAALGALDRGGDDVALADAGALAPLCRLAAAAGAASANGAPAGLAPGSAVTRAIAAALQAADPALRRLALAATQAQGLRALQVEVAGLLAAPLALGHQGVEDALDALAELADGRVVRCLEAILAARPDGLSDHQAWRARRVVQHIRRGGRR